MTWRRRNALDGLADDLRDHLARQTEENIARGMPPEEARRQALITLGNPTLIEEDTRAVWAWRWLEDLRRDLAYAWRSLCRAPAFAGAAVLTLGLGVGAVTSVSTVVYGVLFRPLPFANADRLVRIVQIMRLNGAQDRVGLRPEQVASWSMNSRFLSAIGYSYGEAGTLTGVPTPVRLAGATITPALFRATADAPLEGRLLDDDDALPGNTHVVVLAYRTWTDFFSADRGIVGRSISLNYQPYRVVGVMPQDFDFPSLASAGTTDSSGAPADSPEFWMPLQKLTKTSTSDKDSFTMRNTLALLRRGVTVEQATAEANTLLPLQPSRRLPIELTNPRVEQARTMRPLLLLFEGAVLMVLLIACANVTNLLLARAAYRQRELAIRLSLGAGRGRLARQAAAEGLLLGAAGALIGIVATIGGIAWFRTLPPYLLPRMHEIRVDDATLAFALIVALLAGIAVSLAAAAWTSRRGVSLSLRNSASSVSTTMSRAPLRALVVIEVAAGVVLFAGAALLLSSLVNLTSISPGFDAHHVFGFQVTLPPGTYDGPRTSVFLRQMTTKLAALPQVSKVTADASRLDTGDGISFGMTIDGRPQSGAIRFRTAPAGFFETLGIPTRIGRSFREADESASPRVAIVNETFARRYWRGLNPLGHHISFREWRSLEVVGVVDDMRAGRPSARDFAELYVPIDPANSPWSAPTFFLRTAGDGPALGHEVRSIVSSLDPSLVVYQDGMLETAIERTYADANAYSVSSTTFALVALALAAIGLYGVLAFTVAARTRELGVRVAIGASRVRLIWMVLRDALGTVTGGVVAGLIAAWYLSRLLQNWLYGVTPRDPAILVGVALLFLIVGALAAYVPARRATHIDPVVALRSE